jgi:hypothetical protein
MARSERPCPVMSPETTWTPPLTPPGTALLAYTCSAVMLTTAKLVCLRVEG